MVGFIQVIFLNMKISFFVLGIPWYYYQVTCGFNQYWLKMYNPRFSLIHTHTHTRLNMKLPIFNCFWPEKEHFHNIQADMKVSIKWRLNVLIEHKICSLESQPLLKQGMGQLKSKLSKKKKKPSSNLLKYKNYRMNFRKKWKWLWGEIF